MEEHNKINSETGEEINKVNEHKPKEAEKKEETVSGPSLSINIDSVKSFYKKHKKILLPLLLITLLMVTSIFLRTTPLRMPITDDWAQSTVHNHFQNQIRQQITQQYPNLPAQNIDRLVEKEWQSYLDSNKNSIDQQITLLSQDFKNQFRTDEGELYLLGIDPWHYYRQVYYATENGFPGSEIKEGEYFDSYRLAPNGVKTSWDFHTWFGYILHSFLSLFSNPSLLFSFFLIGTIFSALAVIPAYLIGKKITKNHVGAFFTGLLVATSSFFVSRTTGESSDTDVYVVFFPLLITWLFLEALDAKDKKTTIIYSVLSAIACGVFSFAWSGWWYIFDFILVSLVISIIWLLVKERKNLKNTPNVRVLKHKGIIAGIFIVGTWITSGLLTNFKIFLSALTSPFAFLQKKAVAVTTVWPNIWTTIAELNVPPFEQVIGVLGGKILFSLSIIGIILTLFKSTRKNEQHIFIGSLLVVWTGAALFATTKGVRFILQVVPAFVLCLGAFMGISWFFVSQWINKGLKVNLKVSQITVFIVLCLLMISPVSAGLNSAAASIPSMNDAWYTTLTKIKQEAPQDIVITSWWDFGYWFRAVANRPVTFDGGTQRGYDAYWVGKSLLTDNEKHTAGILRMLNCGQNDAFETLNSFIGKTSESVDTLNQIIVLPKNQAKQILINQHQLTQEQSDQVLELTHCAAPVDYFITSEDMVSKAGVWGHFGSWDFEKAEMYQAISGKSFNEAMVKLEQDFGIDSTSASRIYNEVLTTPADNWVAPWPSYNSNRLACNKQAGENIECIIPTQQGQLQLIINTNSLEISNPQNRNETINPSSITSIKGESISQKKFDSPQLPFSLLLFNENGRWSLMISDPLHAYSTFTKLFFYNGQGLECFQKFDEVQQFNGGKISTWIVNYSCLE